MIILQYQLKIISLYNCNNQFPILFHCQNTNIGIYESKIKILKNLAYYLFLKFFD